MPACYRCRGTWYTASTSDDIEDVIEVLEQGTVKVLKELCDKLAIHGKYKMSKVDLLKELKMKLGIPSEFVKVFSKFWGGSGGWLGAACEHGICYGMKWLLRQEGARDHIDFIKSSAHQPKILVVDFANQVATHGNKRYPGMFSPNDGLVLPATVENIHLAKMDQVSLDMPWLSHALRGSSSSTSIDFGREAHLTTGSNQYYYLFDAFHEENSSSEEDLLRRTRCIKQLEGWFCTEVMEHLNNVMNKNNYFTNKMSPTNAIFVQRLAMEFANQEKNSKIIARHQKQLGRPLSLDVNGQIAVASRVDVTVATQSSTSSSSTTTVVAGNPGSTTSSSSSTTTAVAGNPGSTALSSSSSTTTVVAGNPGSTTSSSSSSTTAVAGNPGSTTSSSSSTTTAVAGNPGSTTSSSSSSTTTAVAGYPGSTASSSSSSSSTTTAVAGNPGSTASSSSSTTTAVASNSCSTTSCNIRNTKNTAIVLKKTVVYPAVESFVFPGYICQSRLGARSGSNACTIIAVVTAEQFLRKKFYTTPLEIQSMVLYIGLILKGNSLYDDVAEPEGQLFDAEEAIQVTGLQDFLHVTRVEGVVDTTDFTALCEEFFSVGGAHIMIIPPDNTVLILVHRNICMSLFDSHSHGSDGAMMFASKCPKGFSAYLALFAKTSHCPSGILGANIFTIAMKKM